MFIERDGKRYELTEKEMRDAYYEQEFLYDREGVLYYLDAFDDDELLDMYSKSRAELEACADDIAVRLRFDLDEYEMTWADALPAAVKYVLEGVK